MNDPAKTEEVDAVEIPGLGDLTDDQINEMSPEDLEAFFKAQEEAPEASKPDVDPEEAQPAAGDEEGDTGSGEADGAASEFQSLNPDPDVAGSTSDDQTGDVGTAEVPDSGKALDAEAGQASEEDPEPTKGKEASDEPDWKAEYESLMAPFKAAKRMVTPKSKDDLRRLAQMGFDYTRKMTEMKPSLKVLKTLEHNDFMDLDKINFAIDLMKGNPEAVKKFLKDHKIDPIELDLEDGVDYKPTDHSVSDGQLALDEVLDSIRDTESFPRVANIITKEWDKASQDILMDNPNVIRDINTHMEQGYYDQIAEKTAYERSLGRLTGLSDLDAYKAVGDAMEANGEFKPANGTGTTPTKQTTQGHSQDPDGSDAGDDDDVAARKRAASPTKGTAGAGKKAAPNFLGMSDEEFAKMSPP
ncbi:MAG: hypothetical protein JRC86_09105 [Deltaproteobacteria bacterium]|nr:hypothetical protein [Deltaproteobacteria bacterium]